MNPRSFAEKIKEKFEGKVFYVGRWPTGYLFGYEKAKGVWVESSAGVERALRVDLPPEHLSIHVIREVMADLCQLLHRAEMPEEPPWRLLNFQNGIFDLKRGTLTPHDGEEEPPFFLSQIPADLDFNIDGEPEYIDDLFESWAPDYKNLLYEFAGYLLLRCTLAKKYLLIYGPGDNAKTTLLKFYTKLVGWRNYSALSMDEICHDRFALASLRGKLLNVSGELVSSIKRTDRLKMITGGDEVFAQEKFRDGFFFKPYAKLVFMGNLVPQTADQTDAFYTRVLIIPFLKSFPPGQRNPKILDGVTKEEMGRFVKKLVSKTIPGLVDRDFTFSINPSVEEIRARWNELSGPLDGFLRELFEPAPGSKSFIPSGVLIGLYEGYRQKKNLLPTTPQELARVMRGRKYESVTKRLGTGQIKEFEDIGFKIDSPCRGWECQNVVLSKFLNDFRNVTPVTDVTAVSIYPTTHTLGNNSRNNRNICYNGDIIEEFKGGVNDEGRLETAVTTVTSEEEGKSAAPIDIKSLYEQIKGDAKEVCSEPDLLWAFKANSYVRGHYQELEDSLEKFADAEDVAGLRQAGEKYIALLKKISKNRKCGRWE